MQLLACAAVFLASVALQADAHSWLTKPVSRERFSQTDEAGTMGCPTNSKGTSTTFKPGETIDVRYPRNNHLGGFIRWAMVPLGKESKAAFDSNVFYYTCRESGATCVPQGQNGVYYGDGGAPANSILCGDTIKLPDWLEAGDYVLQWTWMSAGSSYGHLGWANEQYRSCADIKFTVAGTGKKPSCPAFVGGDRVTKLEGKSSDQCFYFYTNDIVSTVFKVDDTNYQQYYKFGKPAQVDKCGGGSVAGPSSTPASNTTTATPASTTASPSSPTATAPAPAADDDSEVGNGTVQPATGSGKGVWEYCTADSECANGCCSNQLSDDNKKKCTPNVCASLKAGKKDQWQFCSASTECANECCSKRLSDDGQMKCTPGGAC